MLNFTGNSRHPRKVNLSGKASPTTSRQSHTIHSARESRAHRENERRRLKAAIKIQSAFRGNASREATRRRLRDQWDMEQVVSVQDVTAHLVENREEQSRNMVRRFTDHLALLLAFWTPRDVGDRQ